MPSGTTRTGRRSPKTPGSSRAGDDITLMGRSRSIGDPERTAARIRRHWRVQEKATSKKPQSQTQRSTVELLPGTAGTFAERAGEAGGEKGWPIWSITAGN